MGWCEGRSAGAGDGSAGCFGSGSVGAHPVAVAVDVQQRTAKLIFELTLRVDAGRAGIYSRSEVRRRALRRSPVDPNVSTNDDRNV